MVFGCGLLQPLINSLLTQGLAGTLPSISMLVLTLSESGSGRGGGDEERYSNKNIAIYFLITVLVAIVSLLGYVVLQLRPPILFSSSATGGNGGGAHLYAPLHDDHQDDDDLAGSTELAHPIPSSLSSSIIENIINDGHDDNSNNHDSASDQRVVIEDDRLASSLLIVSTSPSSPSINFDNSNNNSIYAVFSYPLRILVFTTFINFLITLSLFPSITSSVYPVGSNIDRKLLTSLHFLSKS